MRGYPGLARWPNFIKKDDERESDKDVRTRKERRCCAAGFEEGGGALNQAVHSASSYWNQQGNAFSPRASAGTRPC